MKINTKWITMAAAVTLSATMAFAAPHDGRGGKFGGHRGRGEFGPRIAKQLNLSEAQQAQIKDIRKSFREQNKAFFESSRETFRELRAAKEANDQARIDALKPALDANREKMQQLRAEEKAQILAILTPEQRAQYEALKAERGTRRHRR